MIKNLRIKNERTTLRKEIPGGLVRKYRSGDVPNYVTDDSAIDGTIRCNSLDSRIK